MGAGLIKPTTSLNWSSSKYVPKQDHSIRITTNQMRQNATSIVDKYPLPRIDDSINSLGTRKIYWTFDLRSGFFHSTIDPVSVELKALITLRGFYDWKRMPQGHASSPGPFAKTMRKVIAEMDSARMYLDATPTQYVQIIRDFLSRLREHDSKVSSLKAIIGAT